MANNNVNNMVIVKPHTHAGAVAPAPEPHAYNPEAGALRHHHHHTGATAHFRDIDDRLANTVEAGGLSTEMTAADKAHNDRFHISHKAPSREDFVDALRANSQAKKQMMNVRVVCFFAARPGHPLSPSPPSCRP
jgi:hypothetical protein